VAKPVVCTCAYPAVPYETASEHAPSCPVQQAWMRNRFLVNGYPEPPEPVDSSGLPGVAKLRTWTVQQLKR
jgi:hypothetical protein